MIEKDTIKELFSRSLENHTTPVRPEVWNGLQAKMAAAGVTSTGAGVAAKGLSTLAKWLIGSAAVTGTAAITTVAILNSSSDSPKQAQPAKSVETTTTAPQTAEQPQLAGTPAGSTIVADQLARPNANAYQVPPVSTPAGENDPSLGWVNAGTIFHDAGTETAVSTENEVKITPQDPQVIVEKPATANETTTGSNSTQAETAYEKAKIEFPNVFTPNGDGDNEFYKFNVCENVKSVRVRIISSFDNNTVFMSTDKDFRWDGTVQRTGEPAPKGLYACSVTYEDLGGNTKTVNFILELIR